MAELMDDVAIAARLKDLPDWTQDAERIRRSVEAPSFLDGIALVVDVARAAEEADHHPDIDIRWRTVTFALSTHSAGGLTTKDFDLAARIDVLAAARAGT
ncbi:4a-hydroxytetrahydrobiopterin dehydratase [Spirillospora sp. CA-294931]|uniref:4a-hydroxytetrahydrobiopterin dehydratase n=1 Tax=Spirillospora sp. CA-294931 TaxID=3240042 RepID=UPI003D9177E9